MNLVLAVAHYAELQRLVYLEVLDFLLVAQYSIGSDHSASNYLLL